MPPSDRTSRHSLPPTELYQPVESQTLKLPPSRPQRRRSLLPWILGGAGCLSIMCCGGIGGTILWWWGSQPTGRMATEKVPVPVAEKKQRPKEKPPEKTQPKTKLEELFSPEELAQMRVDAEKEFWATLNGERGTANTLANSPALQRLCEFRDGYKPLLAALDRFPDNFGDRIQSLADAQDYRNAHALLMALIAQERAGSRLGSRLLCFREHVPNRLLIRYARDLLITKDDGDCVMICSFLKERKEHARETLPILKRIYLEGRGSAQDPAFEAAIKSIQEQ